MAVGNDSEKAGTDRIRGAREQAGSMVGTKVEEAREAAWKSAEKARDRAEAEAERGKNRSAGELHAWASALERAAGELGDDTAQARAIHRAAEQLDDVARAIETRSVGEMIAGLARFGRRNPGLFAGGAVVAGFALSRFATARAEHPEIEEER